MQRKASPFRRQKLFLTDLTAYNRTERLIMFAAKLVEVQSRLFKPSQFLLAEFFTVNLRSY